MEIWQIILSLLSFTGIVSGVVALVLRRMEARLAAKAEERRREADARDKAREAMLCQIVQASWAAIALGEATARAVQRIPDAHCNGDMHAALEYAERVKHEQKEELTKWGVHALW